MSADVAGSPKARRIVDRADVCERRQHPYAGYGHQSPTNTIGSGRLEHHLVQQCELLSQDAAHRQHGLNQIEQSGVVGQQFKDTPLEGGMGYMARKLQAEDPKRSPDFIRTPPVRAA